MNPLDEVPAQLKALEHMSTEELNEFCRKHGQRMKPIRSKRLLQKKVSFMLQAEIFGDLPDVIRQQVYDIGLGQPHIKNAKRIETGCNAPRLSRAALRISGQKMHNLFFESPYCTRPLFFRAHRDAPFVSSLNLAQLSMGAI